MYSLFWYELCNFLNIVQNVLYKRGKNVRFVQKCHSSTISYCIIFEIWYELDNSQILVQIVCIYYFGTNCAICWILYKTYIFLFIVQLYDFGILLLYNCAITWIMYNACWFTFWYNCTISDINFCTIVQFHLFNFCTIVTI